jgi:crossover junction endodeoxyribonuclease RuvC
MSVLGIDPGTKVMGYGVVVYADATLDYLHHGTVKPTGTLSSRFMTVYDEVRRLISAYRPEAVAIESPFLAKNVSSALKLGQVQGVVMVAAAHAGVLTTSYTPMEVKSAVVGYGRASKGQVRDMVQRLLGVSHQLPLDAADALAVAICHVHSTGLREIYEQDRGMRRAFTP